MFLPYDYSARLKVCFIPSEAFFLLLFKEVVVPLIVFYLVFKVARLPSNEFDFTLKAVDLQLKEVFLLMTT